MKPVLTLAGRLLLALCAGALLVVPGAVVLSQPIAQSDYVGHGVGQILIALGVLVALIGVAIVLFLDRDRRDSARNARLVITPRPGQPAPPPAWGMSEIGRADGENLHAAKIDSMSGAVAPIFQGRGGIKVVAASTLSRDVPIVLGVLLLWTIVATLLLAPR